MEGITRRSLVAGSLAALGALALPFTVFADEAPAQEGQTGVQIDATATIGALTISYPSGWTVQESDTSLIFANETRDFLATANITDMGETYVADVENTKAFFVLVVSSYGNSFDSYTPQLMELSIGPDEATCTAFYSAADDGNSFYGLVRFAWSGTLVCMATTLSTGAFSLAENKDTFDAMWASRSYGQAQAAEQPAEEQSAEQPQMTMDQQNALQRAHDYLEYTAFSYSGLIGQLEFEGFSTEDATFAADNCGADWNAQAAAKAQDYLDYSAFSRQGLIDQLIFEGFTAEQAEYGVTAVGY